MKKYPRIESIDLIRSMGILIYIIWHVFINYFGAACSDEGLFRMTFFVTGYFVFASGFIIGFHYYKKLQDNDNWVDLYFNIMIRTIKYSCIVFLSNCAMSLVTKKAISSHDILDIFNKIVSLLYKDRWDISLQVLIVISLTLLIGQLLITICYKKQIILPIVPIVFIFLIFDITLLGKIPYLWRYLAQGIAGVCLGMYYTNNLSAISDSKRFLNYRFLLIACFFSIIGIAAVEKKAYLIFLYSMSVNFITIMSFFWGLFFIVNNIINRESLIRNNIIKALILAGNYSLFAYLIQIIIINLGNLFGPITLKTQWSVFLVSIGIFIICTLLSICLNYFRRLSFINSCYKIIFS